MDKNINQELKMKFQAIIDLIAKKNSTEAEIQLTNVTAIVNDLIDFASSDKELQELSSFQVLVSHLQLKIDVLKISLN